MAKGGIAGIHPTAVIHATAEIDPSVEVGPYCVIGPGVKIGPDCRLGSHVVIQQNTRIGAGNVISSFAALGGDPQDVSFQGEDTWLELGDHNIIREYVSLNRGTAKERGVTCIGSHNVFLSYAHVAHDCRIGSHTVFVNNATLGGHVTVDDYAMIGAFAAVHQFCHIGASSFLARATQVPQDVPPFMMVTGTPGRPCGLNLVGLKRRGFAHSQIKQLKQAFELLYRRDISLQVCLTKLISLYGDDELVAQLVKFIEQSKRGIARKVVAPTC